MYMVMIYYKHYPVWPPTSLYRAMNDCMKNRMRISSPLSASVAAASITCSFGYTATNARSTDPKMYWSIPIRWITSIGSLSQCIMLMKKAFCNSGGINRTTFGKKVKTSE